jgi:hypothetical protein
MKQFLKVVLLLCTLSALQVNANVYNVDESYEGTFSTDANSILTLTLDSHTIFTGDTSIFSTSVSSSVNMATVNLDPITGLPNCSLASNCSYTQILKNSDTITGTYSFNNLANAGQLSFSVADLTITGGTGAFNGATGSGTLVTTTNLDNNNATQRNALSIKCKQRHLQFQQCQSHKPMHCF